MNPPSDQWGRPAAILFDLDGTLVDTAGDIARALQCAFGERGLPLPEAQGVRTMIGRGGGILVERAFAALRLPADAALQATLLEGYFNHYGRMEAAGESSARPYEGVREGLAQLVLRGIRMAVVTNKQYRFAISLLQNLSLTAHFDLVVGGDTCERRKPDPQPLQWACMQLGIDPSSALMVGDSLNDVQAARAAGMPVVCVPYGYNEGRDPRTLPCDAFVESIADLPALWERA